MFDLNILKQKVLSSNMEDSIQGIDQSISIVDKISEILIESINQSTDRFITTERISLLFDSYLRRLRNTMTSPDRDLSFWAASLLMHYNLDDGDAEKILLDSIKFGDSEKISVATVILCRNKNPKVVNAIQERLNDKFISEKIRSFLTEKLNDLDMKDNAYT
jgi:hypothetical protein